MFYRVTQSQISATARSSFAKQSSELFTVQKQISSGLKIQRPADDPAGMRRSLIQQDRIDRLETHESTIQQTKSRLEQAQVHLRDVNDLLTRAKEIALQAPQVTDDSERRILGTELNGLLDQLGGLANATDATGYLFSGTASNTRPFPDASDNDGRRLYRGSIAAAQLHITGEADKPSLLPGKTIFQPVSREPTILTGSTGIRTGTGTDSATGMRKVVVSHSLTTYAAGSGIAAGSNSVTGDTIIGPTGLHRIQINDTSGTGASGEISLNGGPPVSFSSSDTNLMVIGANGEKVFVDTTSITAGFNGAIDITADGSVSLDEGATSTAITFAANQVLTDSRNGTVVNLDTSSVKQTGTDHAEFPGTADIFGVLKELRDDLLNTRKLDPAASNASLNRRLADVERIQDHVLDMIGVQSVSLDHLSRLSNRTGDLKLEEKAALSDTVSADLSASVLRLQELNNLQQFTMAAVGQLLTPNLLNYLQ
jgi:flagellar hook-associated protein 3